MYIKSSELQLQAQHVETRRHIIQESLVAGESAPGEAWSPDTLLGGIRYERINGEEMSSFDRMRLVSAANRLDRPPRGNPQAQPRQEVMAQLPSAAVGSAALEAIEQTVAVDDKIDLEMVEDMNFLILRAFIKQLTGREISILVVHTHPDDIKEMAIKDPNQVDEGSQPPQQRWGLRYRYFERTEEHESTHFSATGTIETADGKSIKIDVALNMSRSFISQTQVAIDMGAAEVKDPLVINFSGTAAELTQTHYEFDLDADGELDQIAFVGPNSGFLALDGNGDGVVNDGSELFGPKTGDGFSELAQFDEDGNGWIDEADTIYSGLRIWSKDADGNDSLIALGHAGVGAIYLGHVLTPFALKDSGNQTQGEIRSTSVYLSEDGLVGTVQQVDLVV